MPGQVGAPPAPGQRRPQLTRESVLAASPRVADRHAAPQGLDRAQGRAHRRPRAHPVPHHGRSQFAADRAAVAVGKPASVLCRVRLGRPRPGSNVKLPDAETVWRQRGHGRARRGPAGDAHLGQRRRARRSAAPSRSTTSTCSPSSDEVANKGGAPVTLYPYALISRHGTPETLGYYILHEGLIGVLGDKGLQEVTYKDDRRKEADPVQGRPTPGSASPTSTGRRRCCRIRRRPCRRASRRARLGSSRPTRPTTCSTPVTVAPGGTRPRHARLFAGAKEVAIVDAYDKALKLNRFELLIDWGWFYFITKPMFWAIDWLFQLSPAISASRSCSSPSSSSSSSSRSPTSPTRRWRR